MVTRRGGRNIIIIKYINISPLNLHPPAIISDSLSQGAEPGLDKLSLMSLAILLLIRLVFAICSSLRIYLCAARLTQSIKATNPTWRN